MSDPKNDSDEELSAAYGGRKIIYRWTPPAREPDDLSDTPDEYAVCEIAERYGGCMILGKYHGHWMSNSSARALVMHLLQVISAAPDLLAACEAWIEYFDKLDRESGPGDSIAFQRKKYHGKRVELTRAAISKAKGVNP